MRRNYEILQQHHRQHPMFARCSPDVREEDRILCRTRAESFAQRECDVITTRPIAQKTLRAFASVHRRPTKLGSVLLRLSIVERK